MTQNISPAFATAFHDAQLAGNGREAMDVVLTALDAGASTMDVYTEIIEPAQYSVGRGWATGKLTVADEHMATAITGYVIAALHERQPHRAPTRGRLVVTGVSGEAHQVGAQIVADALETDGWHVHYLGTDVPEADVVDAVGVFDPDVVCVSATMLENVPAATALIAHIKRDAPRTRILVGGRAFSAWDTLWSRCGADAVAGDVRHAVTVARIDPRSLPDQRD